MRGHCRDGARCAFAHHRGGRAVGQERRGVQKEEEDEDGMECSSSGDEAEEWATAESQGGGELMDVEGSSRAWQEGQQQQSQASVVPYARAGVLSRLLAPLQGGLGPAQLLTIPAFELRRETLARSSGGCRHVRIVCISDTHMKHDFLTPFMPQGGTSIIGIVIAIIGLDLTSSAVRVRAQTITYCCMRETSRAWAERSTPSSSTSGSARSTTATSSSSQVCAVCTHDGLTRELSDH
jgi:hypothetical protein